MVSVAANPIPPSKTLWDRNRAAIAACRHCAFVVGIGDGTLPTAVFAYYIGQDAFFLKAFARAYSLGAAKAADDREFATFHGLAASVLEELDLHSTYARDWGLDLTTVEPGAATQRYTDFLMATAWSQGTATIAAAMAPCMRLYAYLGQDLAGDRGGDNPYGHWIDTYSSAEFGALAERLETLLDREPQITPAIDAAYRYAMDCELNFFDAAMGAATDRS